jgi:exodeoxyribonuclease V alpha subunit
MATEELTGEVASVVFVNAATGFGVVELAASSDDGPRASGPLAGLVPGQAVRLLGRWTEHTRYGPTFEAVAYEHARPRSADGLVAFLSSERFLGVGETLAARIVTRFGLDVGAVIEAEPGRLAEVKGVSTALAAAIGDAWREAGALAALLAELTAAGLSAAAAQAVHRHFGDESRAVIDANPYAVLAVRGVRWAAAESLARAVGVDHLDQRRMVAGAVTAQQQARQRGGHMATATAELVTEARRSLDLAEEAGELAFDDALWWLRADLLAERGVAEEIARLLAARSRLPRVVRDHQPAEELTAEQRAAVSAALHRPVSVLTGGPGTGKTRTVTAIVAACEAHELPVALCAPTGRAANRMEELTGHPATTVHRLLEARGRPGAGFSFGYGALRRLPHDVVVADEWSMADTRLAWALLQAVADGSHVLLVGDADQLPSVGAGAVLRDLLAVDALAATRLTHVHRQAAASRIVTLAHQINAGAVPPLSGRDNDVFVVAEQPLRIAQRVAEIVAVRAPDFYGCAPTDVQVLAPMYRGPAGVDAVNQALKQRLNPTAGRRGVGGFHEGDRVVQTRNDAELDVANGDVGEVVVTDAVARTLEVAFPHGNVAYPADRTADLALGWCLTVHKAQGAEWPVVVLICDPAHRTMLNRDLVYTAVTRARLGLLLVGDARLVVAAAGRAGSGARLRRTRLAQRLAAAVKPVEAVVEIP